MLEDGEDEQEESQNDEQDSAWKSDDAAEDENADIQRPELIEES